MQQKLIKNDRTCCKDFGLDIKIQDLRYTSRWKKFFKQYKNKYDTILIDAFKGLNAPFELTTYEALNKAKNALNENGIVITNIISSLEGKEDDFIKYEYATYKAVFPEVKLFKVRDLENSSRQNLILVGFKNGDNNINEEKYNEYKNLLDMEVKDFTSEREIVTDHFAPIGD